MQNHSSPNGGVAMFRLATVVALAAFLLDWATKSWAVATVTGGMIPVGMFALTVVHNDAFAFSSGSGALSAANVLAVRMSMILLVTLLAVRLNTLDRRSAFGFALLIAGGLGNAADVIFRGGAVVDFISTTPITFTVAGEPLDMQFVFNIADVWVFVGIYLLWPLFRRLGIRAQERVAALERRILARATN